MSESLERALRRRIKAQVIRFGVVLCVAMCGAGTPATVACDEPEWVTLESELQLDGHKTVKFEYDKRNVVRKGEFVKVWRRLTCVQGACGFTVRIGYFLLDCPENTRLHLQGYGLGPDGDREELERWDAPLANEPGSIFDRLRSIVCGVDTPRSVAEPHAR